MLRNDKRKLGCYLMLGLTIAILAILIIIQFEADPKELMNVVTQPES